MRVSRILDSVGGARWLRRAETLAKSIRQNIGVKREIVDGYLLEGKRNRKSRRATVIDPPGRLFVFGPNPVPGSRGDQEFYGYEGAFFGYTSKPEPGDPRHALDGILIPVRRDRLHLSAAGSDPLQSVGIEARPSLRAKLGSVPVADVGYGAYQYDDHGVTRHKTLIVYGRTGYKPAFTATSGSSLYPYGTEDVDKVAVYSFIARNLQQEAVGGMSTAEVEALPLETVQAIMPAGIELDSDLLQSILPSGLRIASVIDRSDPAWDNVGYFTIPGDTPGQGIAAPWAEGDVVNSDDGLLWSVVFWATTPPSTPYDVGGARSLCHAQFRSYKDDSGSAMAELVGGLTVYDPRSSSDALRRPYYLEGSVTRWQPNGFGRPCKSAAGVMTIPHAVLIDDGWYFDTLMLTRAGELIELDLGRTGGRSVCWFIGGDEVDGVVYMINPFMSGSRIAVVSEFGDVLISSRPGWRLPIELTDSSQNTNLFEQPFAEPILRGLAAHIGGGWIGFPVAPSLASRHDGQFAAFNVNTGECEMRGRMWSRPTDPVRDTVMWSRICVIQRNDEDKAILIGGYNEGTRSGRPGKGKTVISYDSGQTWEVLHETIGPGRGCAYAGNGLHAPAEGELWRS